MNLIIDAGNTRIKAAVFDGNTMLFHEAVSPKDFPKVLGYIKEKYPIDKALVSSVAETKEYYEEQLNNIPFHWFTHATPVAINNRYATPHTLGADRLAAAIGAVDFLPNRQILVINAGTCITYEFITSDKTYLGGAISPGIMMRFKALNHFTAKLPLLAMDDDSSVLVGSCTTDAIVSGVQQGVIAEVRGIIEKYCSSFGDTAVLLCGGDAFFLMKKLKEEEAAKDIYLKPLLILEGLNTVLSEQQME